jgi:hypothetical protein
MPLAADADEAAAKLHLQLLRRRGLSKGGSPSGRRDRNLRLLQHRKVQRSPSGILPIWAAKDSNYRAAPESLGKLAFS